jgi:hypothetical protein
MLQPLARHVSQRSFVRNQEMICMTPNRKRDYLDTLEILNYQILEKNT